MKAIGSGLNPKPTIEKDPTEVGDQVKYLYELKEKGVELWNPKTQRWNKDIKRYLVDTLKFKPHDVEKVKTGIKNETKKQNRKSITGMVFKTYEEDDVELENMRIKYDTKGVTSIVEKSSSVTLGRIVAKANGNDTIHVGIYHIDPNNEDKWPSIKNGITNQMKRFDNPSKRIIFKEMDHWVPEISN